MKRLAEILTTPLIHLGAPMLYAILLAGSALLLAGCDEEFVLGDFSAYAAKARQAYCHGLTEEAKQSLRDKASGGAQVIACP